MFIMEDILEFYNKHYITVDDYGRVTAGWSDGPHPDRDTTNAICINEKGGYQFRLTYSIGFVGREAELPTFVSEENPPLYTFDGIPLYVWCGKVAARRTEEEIAADRAAIPEPPPSAQEQLRADVDFLAAMGGIAL